MFLLNYCVPFSGIADLNSLNTLALNGSLPLPSLEPKAMVLKKAGMFTCARWAMEKLADNDRQGLAIVKKMLAIGEAQ